MVLTTICNTVVMIWLPPGLPVISQILLSFTTSVGDMEESGCLRGATMALASASTRPKRLSELGCEITISLFSKIPLLNAATEVSIKRIGDRYHATVFIDRRVMGGLIAFIRL
ncbi:MAG: hypothetical protein GPOALKHO_001696 [Sodalis sp.]|nr:MAG: hypothetical protein GPOALKHO_001696 [Sodalis sp.]